MAKGIGKRWLSGKVFAYTFCQLPKVYAIYRFGKRYKNVKKFTILIRKNDHKK